MKRMAEASALTPRTVAKKAQRSRETGWDKARRDIARTLRILQSGKENVDSGDAQWEARDEDRHADVVTARTPKRKGKRKALRDRE